MKEKKKFGLLLRLVIAIAMGVIVGSIARAAELPVIIGIGATFNSIFGSFLSFCIPLIIIGFIVPGIADLGSGAGKLLGLTVAIAYISTLIAGNFAYAVDSALFPTFLKTGSIVLENAESAEETLMSGYFSIEMTPIMSVMTALIISFVLGIGIAVTKADKLKDIFHQFQGVVKAVLYGVIIPLLPFHIYGIFANLTYAGTVVEVMTVFAKVFAIVIAMHCLILIFQFSVAGLAAKKNPFKMLRNMLPEYLTAVGTQSGAATIPVTLECTKKNGCSPKIADFVIPLCATIHLSGSTITLTSCAMAVMMLNGWTVTFGQMLPFIIMLGVTMVAAPGVPGGGVMAALGILESMLGFNDPMLTLMIALYLAQDSFGTACNCTGDCAIAMLIDTFAKKKNLDPEADK